MFSQYWNVLLVDDDDDVLSISKLAMKNIFVYGVPIRIHTASSKAQAVELLQTTLKPQRGGSGVAVALIDVVMETDHAGLELCKYIREDLNNRSTQLYVRTGQAGVAPERTVVDQYEINGYISKTDATEDKLYSLVKSGVREHGFVRLSQANGELLQELIQVADSREEMLEVIRDFRAGNQVNEKAGMPADARMPARYFIDGRPLDSGVEQEREAIAQRDLLMRAEGIKLNAEGDRYFVQDGYALIDVAASRTCAPLSWLAKSSAMPPDLWLRVLHGYLRAFSALWKKAGSYSSARV